MQQNIIDHIHAVISGLLTRIDRSGHSEITLTKELMTDIGRAFMGEIPMDKLLIQRIKHNKMLYYIQETIKDILWLWAPAYKNLYPWTPDKPIIQALIHRNNFVTNHTDALSYNVSAYIHDMLVYQESLDVKEFIAFLHKQGFTDPDIIDICTAQEPSFYKPETASEVNSGEKKLSGFSTYIIPQLKPSSGLLGFNKSEGLKGAVDKMVFTRPGHNLQAEWLNILLDYYPEGITSYGNFLSYLNHAQQKIVNVRAINLLMQRDAVTHEAVILETLQHGDLDIANYYHIMLELNRRLQGKHRSFIEQTGEQHLYALIHASPSAYFFSEPSHSGELLSASYFDFMFAEDPQKAKRRLEMFYQDSPSINPKFLEYTYERLGTEALPLLLEALKKDTENIPKYELNGSYYTTLFNILEQYDLKPHRDVLITFAVNCSHKRTRELVCTVLSKDNSVFTDAQTLLAGKTIGQRVTAALILSQLDTDEAATLLNAAVEAESNDDTRDIMLEALHDKKFAKPYTREQVAQMIEHATQRKKLNKWTEKVIDETLLPKLYWQQEEEQLNEAAVRFLFYRMKRARGLNSDVEARQLLHYIDRSRSQDFAKALLVAFQDSNADSKLRYYLTLAALLGDDELMHSLNSLFKKNIADKRVKMAEHVVGALAMIGSDKALRAVEVIYRKFANKKPAVSEAARVALDAAATELNITLDELADKIIPNFDFDGIYKTITINGDEYRAFINADFKLSYFTEDNKVRKSLPAAASKELKTEFKEIEKEVNDVVKSQSGRLEKYMVEERRWPVEQWQTFFFNNPIMFVYAMKLLWGVYDPEGKLITSFYCSEDASLYDIQDNEVTMEEGQHIGILHPCHLDGDALNAWKDKLYAMSMVTIFPILERQAFAISAAEENGNFTNMFYDQSIPKGADFVNAFLVKRNWRKSTGDGGSIEFTKSFKDGLIFAYAHITGPAAWYQGGTAEARMFSIAFHRENWRDEIALKNIPRVFYSEVLADIDLMINAN